MIYLIILALLVVNLPKDSSISLILADICWTKGLWTSACW